MNARRLKNGCSSTGPLTTSERCGTRDTRRKLQTAIRSYDSEARRSEKTAPNSGTRARRQPSLQKQRVALPPPRWTARHRPAMGPRPRMTGDQTGLKVEICRNMEALYDSQYNQARFISATPGTFFAAWSVSKGVTEAGKRWELHVISGQRAQIFLNHRSIPARGQMGFRICPVCELAWGGILSLNTAG